MHKHRIDDIPTKKLLPFADGNSKVKIRDRQSSATRDRQHGVDHPEPAGLRCRQAVRVISREHHTGLSPDFSQQLGCAA